MTTFENENAFQSNASRPLADSPCFIVIEDLYGEVQIEPGWTCPGGGGCRLGAGSCTGVWGPVQSEDWGWGLGGGLYRGRTGAQAFKGEGAVQRQAWGSGICGGGALYREPPWEHNDWQTNTTENIYYLIATSLGAVKSFQIKN